MNTKGLESALRLNKILFDALSEDTLTPTNIIACDGLVEDWAPGNYALNDIRNHGGQTWRCCQAHDSTSNPSWEPGTVPALWTPLHAASPQYARPYVAPSGAHDAYQTNECVIWTDGSIYRATEDNVVHDPGIRPEAWEKVLDAPEEV